MDSGHSRRWTHPASRDKTLVVVRLIDFLSLRWLRLLGMRSRYVESSHGRMHVMDGPGRGELPDLVLVHGMSSRGTHYRRFIPRLLPHFRRIIVPDLLHHGLSHAPEGGIDGRMVTESLCEAVAEVIDEPAILFGNSLGGYGALQIAARHPDKVRGVLVASPAGAVMSMTEFRIMTSKFMVRTQRDAVEFVRRLFAAPVPLEWLVAHIVRGQLDMPYVRDFIEKMGEQDFIVPDICARIQAPTRVYWGQQEKMFIEDNLRYYLDHLPNVAVRRPEGWGHSPFTERPDEVAEELRAFAVELA